MICDPFKEFRRHFKILASKNSKAILNTLSNVFTMRLIGNKTHGDLAEIALSEFINQFMYDYRSEHVGKDLFRAKEHEEDILVTNELTGQAIPISLKAYGDGPLQLSTDKEGQLFPFLERYGKEICDKGKLCSIFSSVEFSKLEELNILPLIYREGEMKCNIMHFDFEKVKKEVNRIIFISEKEQFDYKSGTVVSKKGRSHPIFLFVNAKNEYICEVRYGGKSANALQRGFWTHTKHGQSYFDSLTNGWVDYSHNPILVKLFSLALNSTRSCHAESCKILQKGIDILKVIQ